jgi:hypothetical protein
LFASETLSLKTGYKKVVERTSKLGKAASKFSKVLALKTVNDTYNKCREN